MKILYTETFPYSAAVKKAYALRVGRTWRDRGPTFPPNSVLEKKKTDNKYTQNKK
jgi:hypothetical protein